MCCLFMFIDFSSVEENWLKGWLAGLLGWFGRSLSETPISPDEKAS